MFQSVNKLPVKIYSSFDDGDKRSDGHYDDKTIALVAEVTILAISENCNSNESSELPIVLGRQHTIPPEAYG